VYIFIVLPNVISNIMVKNQYYKKYFRYLFIFSLAYSYSYLDYALSK